MAVLLILVITGYVIRTKLVIVPLIALWALVLSGPYLIYADSLPIYNDQLGFVSEVLSGILYGHVEVVQGELSSLGHAYFTSMLTQLAGINPPIWGPVFVQMLLPFAYALPLLTLPYRDAREIAIVMLIVLGAVLNPILYGRTPFAWSYLVLFAVFLYNRLNGVEALDVVATITIVIIYAAYVISDPTSLIIPIVLTTLTIFRRKFFPLALMTAVIWVAINLILYISGSLYSILVQIMALIESPTNPLPSLVAPAANPVMKLYGYLREFTVLITFSIGLAASSIMLGDVLRGRDETGSASGWIALYSLFIFMQIIALAMNRWGMVPYSMYSISLLPILILALIRRVKLLQLAALILAIILVALSPVVKWGFSAIAFPTINDLHEASFITRYVDGGKTCASGAHQLLEFYYRLYNVSSPIYYLDPIFTPSQSNNCDLTAVFYRAFNIYRLGITIEYLSNELKAMDNTFNVVYKNGFWTIWSK
ncbi:hypothetical protein [Pyrobaculum sp.]|uniref:hypothetical protein n=1 Tax=Pyrobaculum sp. TaxID=2004705 RepID=UPI003171BF97